MKNTFKVLGIISLMAVIGFTFAACDLGTGGGGGGGGGTKTVTSILITTQPTKIQYSIGEAFSQAGMVVTAIYSDGTNAAVTGYTTSGFDSTTAGSKTITVTYEGKTATLTVTVAAATTSTTAAVKPTADPEGGTLVAAGATIKLATTTAGAEIWYTTNGKAPAKDGSDSTKYTAPFAITPPVTVKAIAVKDGMTDSSVLTADYPSTPITVANITITAPVYKATPKTTVSNLEQERFTSGTVTWEENDTTFKPNTVYTATVTLTAKSGYTFAGLTRENVYVNGSSATSITNNSSTLTLTYKFPKTGDKYVTSIEIKTQPTKLNYTHGEKLNLTGLAVTLKYEDGTTREVGLTEFDDYGITPSPADATALEYTTYNGKPVKIIYGNLPELSTNNLTVSQKSVADNDVTVEPISAQTYTGSAITPQVTVKHGVSASTRNLVKDTDYTVSYSNNIQPGTNTASVTITGKGDYKDTKTVNFTINKNTITTVNISIEAPVKGTTPATSNTTTYNDFTVEELTWDPSDSPFKASTAYTVKVKLTAKTGHEFGSSVIGKVNNTNATVIKDGESIMLSYTFQATAGKEVSGIAVKTEPTNVGYTLYAPLNLAGLVVTLNYDDGSNEDVAVTAFTDKSITTNPESGTLLTRKEHFQKPVTIIYGSYTANTTKTLSVNAFNLSLNTGNKVTVDPIPDQPYTGSPIKPEVTVKHTIAADNVKVLEEGTDYTLKYESNTDIGTAAKITITGITTNNGNYSGSMSKTFTIVSADPDE